MGYIIPVQPLQSQIYANRMQMEEYNFAQISNVQSVKMKSLFDNHLTNLQQNEDVEQKEEKQLSGNKELSSLPLYKGFIQPNPVNLSPIIAEISGKGHFVNTYI
ncbi:MULTISPECIES: hypothetical protein [unclassified Psychrobacillus]|uniref:hypothetical protein n=1 Tax=unclassified Psychrobacillus TaxID=2636677 RepID=UPI00146BED25|nr:MULTISPECIES: hypothetical protein [unclassified Psychrobacillus]MCM3358959.1 hypothetical protein [Psychrobacillus sp. MER TA 171]NME05118.1 hypothetical protein [Psychrobacillus sp. BL-248-WT-3]